MNFYSGQAVLGWVSSVLAMHVLGAHLGRIYAEVKPRPRYFIDQMKSSPNLVRTRLDQISLLVSRFRNKWPNYEVYVYALLIFAASRVVVIIGVNFGELLIRQSYYWDAGAAWYYRLLRWDSGWYNDIIVEGYRADSPSSAFYPLYPLISYTVETLIGSDQWLALLLVANVAAIITVLLLTKFIRDELGEEVALLSLTFFCFFPSSMFLSAGYTESLCLLFILLSFVLLNHEKFLFAAAMAGLSLATRSIGIVMMPVILYEIWRRNSQTWPRLLLKMALCSLFAASGLLAYMAYLGIEFGHPMAFAASVTAWRSETFLDRFVAAITLRPFQYSSSHIVGLVRYGLAALFLGFLALTVWSFWRLRVAVALYGLGSLMLPYLTIGITGSMNRYVLMCFPAFMCVGLLCKGRMWLAISLIGISAALLLYQTALFSQWYFVG
jgi:Gpi18-like mannosyltransferase